MFKNDDGCIIEKIELSNSEKTLFEILINPELRLVTEVNKDIYANLTDKEKEHLNQIAEEITNMFNAAALR